ncbi:MAG: Ig-like domain repeat protein [Candidatus Sulfotelmatobacter sp.]
MTRRFARKLHTFKFFAVFLAAITILAFVASQAQQTDTRKPSAASSAASVPMHAIVSAEPLAHPASAPVEAPSVLLDSGWIKKSSAVPLDSGNPLFLTAVPYDSGGVQAASVAIADVNGDGKPDLLVANNSNCYSASCDTNGTVGVLLGNGDGTFQPAVSYSSGGGYAVSVAVADVNGDGKPDLVVASQCVLNSQSCANGSLGVLLGNGDGTFQPAVAYALNGSGGALPESVSTADVNGDGKPDLAVVLYGSQVNVLLGNGDGTFQPAVTWGLGCCNTSSLAVADVNGDGKPDLLLVFAFCNGCQSVSGQVGVMLGNGDGTFQPLVLYDSGGDYPLSIAVADVNDDGKADLVVANSCSNDSNGFCSGPGSVSVLFGNGDGTFQVATIYSSPAVSYFSVAVADANGDGKPDLLAVGCASTGGTGPVYCGASTDGSLAVLINNGDGTFQPAVLFDAGGFWPKSIAIADLNGSGRPDAVVASWRGDVGSGYNGSVGVLLNSGGSSTPATTVLASSLNPSNFGQSVTFTAAVSSASGTTTGTVIFYNGSAVLGSVTLAGGSALLSTRSLAAGSHSITAAYQGSAAFAPSTSSPLTQVVYSASTTTSVRSSANPAGVNKAVTYTATVIGQDGGVATGSVTFQDGGTTIATVAVYGNQAAYSTTYSMAGVHSITATYSGDASNGGSVSASLTEYIGKEHFPTETILVTSGSPSFVGQPVTLMATATSIYGVIPDGELVTFYDDGTELGTGTTASGVATLAASSLIAKTHTLKATYAGDATFERSSGTTTQVVNKYATNTTLVSSLNPSVYGQSVTWTATVTSTGPNTPTGSVRLVGLGYAPLSGGVATFTNAWLNAGTDAITAEYEGDVASATSASSVLNQVVNAASTTTVITSSDDPSTLGENVTFTATVTSSTGAHATGTVTFRADATVVATVPLDGIVATYSTATLGEGSYAITAIYNGATDFTGSQDTLIQSIEP